MTNGTAIGFTVSLHRQLKSQKIRLKIKIGESGEERKGKGGGGKEKEGGREEGRKFYLSA